jgi:GSH-dependent disulfide-bond oxidoreductase
MIELHAMTAATPRRWMVSIALDVLHLPHVVPLASTPSVGPIDDEPVLVERDASGGVLHVVHGAHAILIHLARKSGRLLPAEPRARDCVLQWLAADKVLPDTGDTTRHRDAVRRLFGLLDGRLRQVDYLAGDYSIADIAHWAVVRLHAWSSIDLSGYPALARWVRRMAGGSAPASSATALPVYRVRSILLR